MNAEELRIDLPGIKRVNSATTGLKDAAEGIRIPATGIAQMARWRAASATQKRRKWPIKGPIWPVVGADQKIYSLYTCHRYPNKHRVNLMIARI